MPAIQLSKLTEQTELMLKDWQQPERLLSRLVDLLEYYADHLYQPAEQIRTTPGLPIYRVPPIVLRNLERSFSRTAAQQPQAGLDLAEILWQHGYSESLLLSAAILGGLPGPYHQLVIQRIFGWANMDLPASLVTRLIELATRQVRQHSLSDLLTKLSEGLNSDKPGLVQFSFLVLQPLIEDPKFENLPFVYRVITPFVQQPPADFLPELVDLIGSLATRSPAETTYFLRKLITPSSNQECLRLLRRALPSLPEAGRASLFPLLREQGGENQ